MLGNKDRPPTTATVVVESVAPRSMLHVFATVASVRDEDYIFIGRGDSEGVAVGQEYAVYEADPWPVKEYESDVLLGFYDFLVGRVQVDEVFSGYAVCSQLWVAENRRIKRGCRIVEPEAE